MRPLAERERDERVLGQAGPAVYPGCDGKLGEVETEKDELRGEMGRRRFWEQREQGFGEGGWELGESCVDVEVEGWVAGGEEEGDGSQRTRPERRGRGRERSELTPAGQFRL